MNIGKVSLRSVRVEYIMGKYAFKQRINGLNPETYKIELSGAINILKTNPTSIKILYDTERSKGRLDSWSRMALKGLQMNLSNPAILLSKGVTHIIVYEIINK